MTKEDLQVLRIQIVGDIKELYGQLAPVSGKDLRGYKSKDVRNLLGCSAGKLKSLRAGGRIRTKKIGGTIYYNKEDVQRLLTAGF